MAKTGPLPNYLARVALAGARTAPPARPPAAGPLRLPDRVGAAPIEAPPGGPVHVTEAGPPGPEEAEPTILSTPRPRAEAPPEDVPPARPTALREPAETKMPPRAGARLENVPTVRMPGALRPPAHPPDTGEVVRAGSSALPEPSPPVPVGKPPGGRELPPVSTKRDDEDGGSSVERPGRRPETEGDAAEAVSRPARAPSADAGVVTEGPKRSRPPRGEATPAAPVPAAPTPAAPGVPAVAPRPQPGVIRPVAAPFEPVRATAGGTEPWRESRRVRVSIGRMEVQVNNPPPAPPAARPMPPAPAPADIFELRLLGRFRLGS
jgi:hypothetical protein